MFEDPSRGTLVAAHRGYHAFAPENSIAAIEAAIEAEIDIVELDVQLTADGVPVLMHDQNVDRTTNGQGRLSDLTFEQVRTLRLLNPNGAPSGNLVPTLEEALAASAGRIFVNVDLKGNRAVAIVKAVGKLGALDQVMFYVSDRKTWEQLSREWPDGIFMPIAREEADVSEWLEEPGLRVLHLREPYNSPTIARQLDAASIAGWTNALGDADQTARQSGAEGAFAEIISNRPDIIQTDEPVLLRQYLRQRDMHWSSLKNGCEVQSMETTPG